MIIPLLPRNTTDNNSVTTAPSTADGNTNHAHTPLAHLNLVGILVIAALLALGLVLSLCFAKWSKPIRRFFRGEHSGARRLRFGIGHCLPTLSKASRPPPPPPPPPSSPLRPPTPQSDAADAEKATIIIPDSSSSKTSLDRDPTEIDKVKERANVEVALPAKVLHAFTIKSGSQLARLGQ